MSLESVCFANPFQRPTLWRVQTWWAARRSLLPAIVFGGQDTAIHIRQFHAANSSHNLVGALGKDVRDDLVAQQVYWPRQIGTEQALMAQRADCFAAPPPARLAALRPLRQDIPFGRLLGEAA